MLSEEVLRNSVVFGYDNNRGINSDDLERLLDSVRNFEPDSSRSWYVTEVYDDEDPIFVLYYGENALSIEQASEVYVSDLRAQIEEITSLYRDAVERENP